MADDITIARIQFRHGLSTEWTSANPVLAAGEPGFETNTGKFKIGDGVTAWNSLLHVTPGTGGGGVTDHGALTGLSDDDHPQYATDVDLASHEADTTNVHGITDTATLYRAGGTDIPLMDGGTGASDASGARTNLGLGSLATLSTITSANITDGTIVNIDISGSAAIALSKLATDPLARANHTGTQSTSTLSDFNTNVDARIALAGGGGGFSGAAVDVSYAGTSGISAANVEAALDEIAAEFTRIDGSGQALGPLAANTAFSSLYSTPFLITLEGEDVNLTAGNNKSRFRMPFGFTVTGIRGTLAMASTSGGVTIDVNQSGVSILSTKLTFDVGEKSTATASVPVVISEDELGDDAEISIDIDVPGTGARGLKLWFYGMRNDGAAPPPPPSVTTLVTELFNGQIEGEVASETTTTADSHSGSGTLTHATDWSLEGGGSMKVSGTAAHTLRWEKASHTTHYAKFYYRHTTTPSETAYIHYQYAADGTTVAYRIGITNGAKVVLQDSTTGSGGGIDTTVPSLETGKFYRFDLVASDSLNTVTLAIYNEANINATSTVNAIDNLSITLTANNFSDEIWGLVNTISGGSSVTGNQTNEGFNGATSGAPTTSTVAAISTFGSGTLTHSTTFTIEGAASLRLNGTASHVIRFGNPSHNNHYVSFYYRHVTSPGATAWILQQRTGDNAGVAFQVGIQANGTIRIRDSNNGTGGGLDTSNSGLSTNTTYRIDVTALGAGDLTLRYYTGANLDSTNTADAVDTLTCTLTATNFGDEQVGNNTSVSTLISGYIDRWKADDTALPSPVGAGSGSGIVYHLERILSHAISMPASLTINQSGGVDAILVPTVGCWFGAATPPIGGQQTNSTGLNEWMSVANRRPDILHYYYTNGAFVGQPSQTELNILEPAGQPRAIWFANWKIDTSLTWAQIANGGANGRLLTACNGMKQFPYKFFLSLYHEPEDDVGGAGSGNTRADYVNMWRFVVNYIRTQGVTNAVFCWILIGYSGGAGTGGTLFEQLYPGDSYVDWICWEPYFQSLNREDFGFGSPSLINENVGGASSYTGFYNWAHANHPNKPLGVTEWGLWHDVITSDSEAAARYTSIGDQISDFPQIKQLLHWNNQQAHDNKINKAGRPLSQAAFQSMCNIGFFNVGTENAP